MSTIIFSYLNPQIRNIKGTSSNIFIGGPLSGALFPPGFHPAKKPAPKVPILYYVSWEHLKTLVLPLENPDPSL